MHETQCAVTDDGHHEMQVSGVYLALMSSLFMYSGFLMSPMIHSLINVLLIDAVHKVLHLFALKTKLAQITIFVCLVPIASLASSVKKKYVPSILLFMS